MRDRRGPLLGRGVMTLLLAASSLLATAECRQLAVSRIGASAGVLQDAQLPLPAAAQWRQQLWHNQRGHRSLGTAAMDSTTAPTAAAPAETPGPPAGKDTDYIVAIVVGER